MKSTIYLIHRWEGIPSDDWYPWLKRALEPKGFQVTIPAMPHTDSPVIAEWVNTLQTLVPHPKSHTIFIGHSIGCQAILRYLALLPQNTQMGPVYLVAPWTHLENLEDTESENIAKPWLQTPLPWNKAKTHVKSFTCLFSTNDPWVPQSEINVFKTNLSATCHLLKNRGHFTDVTFTELLQTLVTKTNLSTT